MWPYNWNPQDLRITSASRIHLGRFHLLVSITVDTSHWAPRCRPRLYIVISAPHWSRQRHRIFGPCSTSLPYHFGDILVECLMYIEIFLALLSIHGSKENDCTSLLKSPRSLRMLLCGEPQFATMTHTHPGNFWFRHIPGSRFPEIKKMTGSCACAKKCQQFSTITDVAEERWRLLLTEINCPASASSLGNRPIILFVGQLDFTTVSKRSSWKSGHYNFNDKPTFIRVTLALACVFDSKFPSHKERDLKFFHGRLSLLTHPLPPPPLKKHGLLLCQEPPLRTDFEPGALSNSSHITLRRSIMTVKLVSCLNHMLTIIFLGHVPCSFLVWFQSIHLWACCGTIFSIQEYRHFLWPFELYSPWKKASIHREEGGGGLAKVPGPSPTPVLASLQAALPLHIFRFLNSSFTIVSSVFGTPVLHFLRFWARELSHFEPVVLRVVLSWILLPSWGPFSL